MKKCNIILGMMVVTLVFGLALTGCDSDGSTKGAPNLIEINTALVTGVSSYIRASSFTSSQRIGLIIKFSTPYKDMGSLRVVIKQDKHIIDNREVKWSVPRSDSVYERTWGTVTLPYGTYTAEVYLVDVEGNKSRTLSTTIRVTG